MHKVKVEQFEGPHDLLLNLIEKEKLDITKISLAKITDEYIELIPNLDAKNHDIAEFLLVASKLLYYKSRVVLPHLNTQDEEDEIDDLEARLKEYRVYKEAAKRFHETLEQGYRSFKKGVKTMAHIQGFTTPDGVSLDVLMETLKDAMAKLPEEVVEHEKKFERLITVEEKVEDLRNHLKSSKSINFRSLINKAKTKHEVVVSFLAILDLIKEKVAKVSQKDNFSDIIVEAT